MKAQEDTKKRRRSYQKPRVEQVELRPEEAVLGGCKNFDQAQPGTLPPNPLYCHLPQSCAVFGS